ncbi:Seventh of septin 1 [Hanseniaspora osmophila]|uniref:Seventh of septin 1 n=1 Tax=Hanseniaspora osmophila TaxID=56408 RepID=A0A1E5RNZ9_9ASCO|nr:Seventh of septin 1 [Hanseniaspora osmophila]
MSSISDRTKRNISSNILKRKEHHRHVITYSVMLIGQDGLGKTTFANNLLDKAVFTHKYADLNSNTHSWSNEDSGSTHSTHSSRSNSSTGSASTPSVTITRPAKTVLYTDTSNFIEPVETFDPKTADKTSGTFQLKSTTIEVKSGSKDDDILSLNLLKTSGLGTSLDNEFCFDELTSYLEQQFDSVLAEEIRIKRNPRFEDSRIHVALYFVEPNGHGLKELDVLTMKKLSKYTNVLPIISRSDALNAEELKTFKQRVLSDLDYYNVPVYKFVTNDDFIEENEPSSPSIASSGVGSAAKPMRASKYDIDEQDLETLQDNQMLESLQPFAIICSDSKDDVTGHYTRSYQWANESIDVEDPTTSDLALLKRVLFGSHLQDFKDTMVNFLYENYRATKLSSAMGSFEPSDSQRQNHKKKASLSTSESSVNVNAQLNNESTTPSLSNFQKLVINGEPSTYSLNKLAKYPDESNTEQTSTLDTQTHERETGEHSSTASQHSDSQSFTSNNSATSLRKTQLRNISHTVPYQLKRERILAQKQKLEELETNSAKELQKRIEELERKAAELKKREKLLKAQRVQSVSGASSPTINNTSVKKEIEADNENIAVKTEVKKEVLFDSGAVLQERATCTVIKQEASTDDSEDAQSQADTSVLKTDVTEGM